MSDLFGCDVVRTPIGRYGGALLDRHPSPRDHIDEVVLGCANQAGEDNRMHAD